MTNWKKIKNNIPHRVRIKSKVWYEILWVSDFKDGKTLGESRFNEKQIVLLNSMSPKLTVSTFIHELYHVISHEYGADLTENQVLKLEDGTSYFLPILWSLNS